MDGKVIKNKQDLTYLKWSHIRNSSGTAGTFLKSESSLNGIKTYYKLSNFDAEKGVVGHECVNEIIVDRLLTILGIPHLCYKLINADIEVDGRIYNAYICASDDFKTKGESKVALDDYYRAGSVPGESHYDFCRRMGFEEYIDQMIAVDYIILNRDRHGANIEVLRKSKQRTYRLAPLFDHGLSLIYSCITDSEAESFDAMADRPCQNFIGTKSCYENLQIIKGKENIFKNPLTEDDKNILLADLEDVISPVFQEKIWAMIYGRYKTYEKL